MNFRNQFYRVGVALLPGLPSLLAALTTFVLFMLFLTVQGKPAWEACQLVVQGAFGSAFALESTLQRAAPLMLTALCVALPARAGLIIIGGEGALVLGGLAAAVAPLWLPSMPTLLMLLCMAFSAMLVGGFWIGLNGWMRQKRGLNETIGSLLLSYIAIALFNQLVEGPLRDPASLNKPSTVPLGDDLLIGPISDQFQVHWGLVVGIIACVLAQILVRNSVTGFSLQVVGGNVRTARMMGLPVDRLVILTCVLGGACAGLAGMFEVAAVQGSANAAIIAGYGASGILVAFAARQNPLAIIACAILLGGIEASGSLLQRRLGLPDATTLILEGILFTSLLAWEALTPRIVAWRLRLNERVIQAQGALQHG
ncbi:MULTISPECIES: ABC transporter permease [Pseudomonas]|uniref:ABC transporter permease n=1 Tax=Pseudomonas neustonica TaxID=2487346 RepID=A0ABX9XES4_9PSED|nr:MULTISPECIES: ABC transporter permease [Pseudomonas]MAB25207.1 ABC transporter permease [Pseudomonadales bacterium]MBA6419594.1 ABC transporter permease [Pseudomonas sp. 5Ae-yellow]ROZ79981.1 ABC transporter permease [Pseudomonas sp. SSM44]ROZ80608.1 ABC transporter permease [Pseudomonas neustonica]|tara:strand:- start:5791 stop:6897 length:1107 start_codon:yes stop_codon:yes gene_type:complete